MKKTMRFGSRTYEFTFEDKPAIQKWISENLVGMGTSNGHPAPHPCFNGEDFVKFLFVLSRARARFNYKEA